MKRTLFILLLIPLLFLHPPGAHSQEVYQHSVLIIHSYHPSMQWVKEVQQGIDEKMRLELGTEIDLKVEYMDSKRYNSATNNALLAEIWRYKYKNNPPDCIIVCDDNALNLVLALRKVIFTDVPIVFCGVNFYDQKKFSAIDNITGVVEAYDLPGTLKAIKQLFPEKNKIFIINDDTTTGRANKARLEEIAYDFSGQYTFIYSGKISATTLESVVQTLQDDTAVLLMSFNRDSEDHILRYRDAIQLVRENSPQPIFGVWSFYLGKGIVGGSLVNGQSQGRTAANLCIRILQGESPAEIPVVTKSPNVPMFDFKELRRFSISNSTLPPESRIVNVPDTSWHRYRAQIITGIVLFMVQSVIIALLIYNFIMRKKDQQVLIKNKQNLTITLEAIAEAVFSVDADYRIIRANSAAASLLEMEPDRLPGVFLPDLLSARFAGAGKILGQLIKQCIARGVDIELPEKTIIKQAGRPARHLSGTCSPIRSKTAGIIGAVLVCHDITERESMREMLAHSQKMEAIGQLAGGVAHDFNNLLAGISGFAEILSIQLEGDEQKLDHAQKILNAADRAKDLTRQLLSFARKGKIISRPLDCHEALLSSIGLLERSINKNISLITRLDADHSTIMGDPVQLENMFLNLGINSADAMENGGKLIFTTSNQVIEKQTLCEFGESLSPGFYLLVNVQDSGCGISPEIREHIFEPFYTTKKNGKGTGLGLSAVFGTMKEHNGKIQLHSEVGSGTEFHLFFPITTQDQVQQLDSAPLLKGSGTILLIDDETIVLSSTKALLEELGYVTLTANGCREGVRIYQENHDRIELVLLDMIMPEMDGSVCFTELKKINPEVKVVISSGFATAAKMKEVEELGAKAFLQKPYSVSSLSATIQKVMEKK